MDRLTAANVFLETVARGSISAAALHLGMSRAMATRYIGHMEEWAEARLLHRTTRKLSLTAAGEGVLPLCKDLVALSQDVSALGVHAESMPKGQLRITASSIFSEYCLTDIMMDFLQMHPAVSIDLQIVDRAINLAEEGIDLAIRVTNNPDPNVIAKKLGEVRSVVCASPSYLAAHGVPAHVMDLAAHNCLTYAYYGRTTWQFSTKDENFLVPVSGNFTTNEAAIVVRAAMRGSGVALLPHFAANAEIETGRLVELVPGFRVNPMSVYAVYLSRHRVPPAMRALIEFLSERLKDYEV
ncbi:LysR family transcriptional regulator [Pseudomonas syringae]|uniref:LysR family transcriptional regulator n=1 Tax=Pseudomonas syringae TaxID=317 RepID=UPI00215B2CCB|nr:LysR family transcriptional regulator [Pseudomonas syringae]MCR8720849.1 LysR family transcriptional regulator [Pseudomonas syringae]